MIIYLKSGQTIDMGDVIEIMDDDNHVYKPCKYCNDGDAVIDLTYNSTDVITYTFCNSNNERLEVKENEIIGIREDEK